MILLFLVSLDSTIATGVCTFLYTARNQMAFVIVAPFSLRVLAGALVVFAGLVYVVVVPTQFTLPSVCHIFTAPPAGVSVIFCDVVLERVFVWKNFGAFPTIDLALDRTDRRLCGGLVGRRVVE